MSNPFIAVRSYYPFMPLILTQMPPWHWAVSGAGIAAVTLCLLFLANRRLGISTGFEDACSLVLHTPYFRRDRVADERASRLQLLAGLVIGGFLSALLGGGWEPTWDLGMFDEVIGWGAGA